MTDLREAIWERYASGETQSMIARSYRLSRERIRQVINQSPDPMLRNSHLLNKPETCEQRIRRERSEFKVEVEHVVQKRKRKTRHGLSDEEMFQALRDWRVRHGDPVSIKRWNEFKDPEFPSGPRYLQRYGTWNEAKSRAGLPISKATRVYAKEFTDVEIQRALIEYVIEAREQHFYPSSSVYETLSPLRRDWPSLALLRVRLIPIGSWSMMLEWAIKQVDTA